MPHRTTLSSPFEKLDNVNYRPAVAYNDKRLLPEQGHNLDGHREATQWQPGQSGNQGHTKKAGIEKLEIKLQEYCTRKKMSYEDAINDTLVKGALGQVKLSPTQLAAIIHIQQTRFGKPAVHEQEGTKRPILIMNGPTQVLLEK